MSSDVCLDRHLAHHGACVCLRRDVHSRGDDWSKLTEQVEWTAQNGQMFQVRRAGTWRRISVNRVTLFVADHETNPSTSGFTGLSCSVHPSNGRCYSWFRYQGDQPCFRQKHIIVFFMCIKWFIKTPKRSSFSETSTHTSEVILYPLFSDIILYFFKCI